MANPIIQLEKPIMLGEKVLMRDDGSITQDGMNVLDRLWRDKDANKPSILISYMDEDLKHITDELLDNTRDNGLPTFFLTIDIHDHWRSGFFYRLQDDKERFFVFDSAALEFFPLWKLDGYELEDLELTQPSEEDETLYFRNERLLAERGNEKTHLVTDSGCAMFALKYVHKLIDLFADKSYEEAKRLLMPREAVPDEQIAGVDYVFPMPDELLYLSHLSWARGRAKDTVAVEQRAQSRKIGTDHNRNNTVEYFVLKAAKKLTLYVGQELFSLAIQSNNWRELFASGNDYYLRPYINQQLQLLRGQNQALAVSREIPGLVIDSDERRLTFILGYLIYHNPFLSCDDIQFLLDIPAVRNAFYTEIIAPGSANRLLGVALARHRQIDIELLFPPLILSHLRGIIFTHFQSVIKFENFQKIKEAFDKTQEGDYSYNVLQVLRQIDIPNDECQKLASRFARDSFLRNFIVRQFQFEANERHFSKFYQFAELDKLLTWEHQIRRVPRAASLNVAHELLNCYNVAPAMYYPMIKQELEKVVGLEKLLAFVLIAHKERDEKAKQIVLGRLKDIREVYSARELSTSEDLFSSNEGDIAQAILTGGRLAFDIRKINFFIHRYKSQLAEALASGEMTSVHGRQSGHSAGFFCAPIVRERQDDIQQPLAKRHCSRT